jgi:hypothetical protein
MSEPNFLGTVENIEANFTSLSETAQDVVRALGGVPAQYALEFTAANKTHVNHGAFWKGGEQYSIFFADFLIKPTGGQYFISAGYGGSHCLLFGVTGDENGYGLTGNIRDEDLGISTSFTNLDLIRHNEWAYVAIRYDGVRIYLYVNGVLSSTVDYTGKRKTSAGSDSVIFIGGSDHQNFTGRIAGARIFEGYDPLHLLGTYAFRPPVENFALASVYPPTGELVFANFLADYRNGNVRDSSQGLPDGIRQIETATAAGAITGSGNATVIVTGAEILNSPKTLAVAVTNGDSAATWGGKVRTALAADADITRSFIVSGTTTAIILQRRLPAPNDTTLNISLDNGTCTGITTATISANTTQGVLAGYAKHNGYLAEATEGVSGVGGTFLDPVTGYNRTASLRPQWVIDTFEYPTDAPASLTPIVGARIYDDFRKPDVHYGNIDGVGNLGLGTTKVGSKLWNSIGYGILNGLAYSTQQGVYAILDDSGAGADKTVIARRPYAYINPLISWAFDVVFRYQDSSNYHMLVTDEFGQGWIYEVVGGVAAVLGATMSFGTSWTEAKVVITGNSVEAFADGVSKGVRTMTHFLTAKSVGMSLGATARASEFAVI